MPNLIVPSSRRQFLKQSSGLAAASAFAGLTVPFVHAAENNTVDVALIGCGGRGSGAAAQALSVVSLPTRLTTMADVFGNKLNSSHSALEKEFENKPGRVDVPEERRFLGFDAYKQAMDALKPGSIAILTTPLAFRALHFKYAIDRGLHVFMEKPVTADGPTSRRMLELGEEASKKNLKVGVGLMVRHCRARQELWKRIQDGEIGDITHMRSYRMHGPVASAFSLKKPEGQSEVMYQIERFHSFLWASGGLFSDFYIHFIDETCWMKNAWPVKAHALGGRHYRGDYIDQNLDTYSVEYTFEDGTQLFFDGRTMTGCKQQQASYAHGTKGSAIISFSGHTPGKCRIFPDQRMKRGTELWAFPEGEPNPYQTEWDDLTAAIINDTPYSEVKRGVEASIVTSMGRMAAHTGREVTFDQMLNCPHEFAPGVGSLTADGPAPVMPDATGHYPVPEPGIKLDREYLSMLPILRYLLGAGLGLALHAGAEEPLRRYLYAATPDGAQFETASGEGLLVFDIDNRFKLVRRIGGLSLQTGTRGLTGCTATHSLYYSTTGQGMGRLDLETDKVVWESKLSAGCDRSSVLPDGSKVFAPTGWWDKGETGGLIVVDGTTGKELERIPVGQQAHNSIVSPDGSRLFLGTTTTLTVLNPKNGKVIQQIKDVGEAGVFPFTINHDLSLACVCLGLHVGFDVVDLTAGRAIHRVLAGDAPISHRTHGAALSPDESELWISDQIGKQLFVFDATKMPPVAKTSVVLSVAGHGWVNFSMDGAYAWSHAPEVFDARTKKIVATLRDESGKPFGSSKLIEVQMRGSKVIAVSNEFGLGRKK